MENSKVSNTFLPVAVCCQIAGVDRSHVYDWRRRSLLDLRGSEGQMTERDTVEASVLSLLSAEIGAAKARIAFRRIRDDLRSSVPVNSFEIVWDDSSRLAIVARTDGEVLDAVRCSRMVVVIDPRPEIRRVRAAWRAEVEDRSHTPSPGKQRRTSTGAQ